jgi:hypothetical protein
MTDLSLKGGPPEWCKLKEVEVTELRDAICKNLELCVALNDHRKGAKYFVQHLDRYLDCKYPLTSAHRVHLSKQMLALIIETSDPLLQVTISTTKIVDRRN